MIAGIRGRRMPRIEITLAALGMLTFVSAGEAQLLRSKSNNPPPKPAEPTTRLPRSKAAEAGGLVQVAIPANPTDAIAIVNGEPITRQELADEAVAKSGKEVLDALIARKLIEQAIKTRKLNVTAVEIDEEIESVGQRLAGLSRENWLRVLDKERGISPAQYARDIIFPSLALRKLATPRVQVTPKDLDDAFQANFGEKLRCRIIMVDKQRSAIEIWEQLKQNPSGFEKLAKERSIDTSTRALGGVLPEPISRHAFPRNVSDAAFAQLVDGDPADKDPTHKPKDGDFTGPVQIDETAWIILKRESLEPAKEQDKNNPAVKNMLHSQMFEAKLKEAMNEVFNELNRAAAIDNKFTGHVKLANEEQHPASQTDGNVRPTGATSNAPARATTSSSSAPRSTGAGVGRVARPGEVPAGLPADAVRQTEAVRRSLKTRE